MSKRSYHPLQRSPLYDPQFPFEYYLSRAEETEMRTAPPNLRMGSKFDTLSSQMWDKFQQYQQTRETYHSKMVLWRYLHNAVRVSFNSTLFFFANFIFIFFFRPSLSSSNAPFPNGACISSDQQSQASDRIHPTSTCVWYRKEVFTATCEWISEWSRWWFWMSWKITWQLRWVRENHFIVFSI